MGKSYVGMDVGMALGMDVAMAFGRDAGKDTREGLGANLCRLWLGTRQSGM